MAKKQKATVIPKMKSYVSDFTMSLGPLQWSGTLVAIRDNDKNGPKFTLASPEGNPVVQMYYDEVTKKYHLPAALTRSFIKGDEQTIVTQDEQKVMKKSDKPPNILPISIHDAAEVDQFLYPADSNGYVFTPDNDNPQLHQIFNALKLALQSGKAIVGICNLRGHEGLFRVGLWRGQVIIQKQCYPAEIKEHEVVKVLQVPEADESWTADHVLDEVVTAVFSMVARQTQPFDPDTYANAIAEKQYALLANPNLIQVETPDVQQDVDSILASIGLLG